MQKYELPDTEDEFFRLVGQRIRELRRFHKEEVQEVAAVAGITGYTLGYWERGSTRASLYGLARLAAHWQVPLDTFFSHVIARTKITRPSMAVIVAWLTEFEDLWGTKADVPLDILRAVSMPEHHAFFREAMTAIHANGVVYKRRRGPPRSLRMDNTDPSPVDKTTERQLRSLAPDRVYPPESAPDEGAQDPRE